MIMQAVLDTNVLVSAVRSSLGASYQLLKHIKADSFQPIISVPLVLEYEDVLSRSELHSLSDKDIRVLLDFIAFKAKHQQIDYLWRPFLPDPKDNMVLEVAFNGAAKCIVTHNLRDFKGCEKLGITAITPSDFLKTLGGSL
jgi:putative PIN family toxin of toxin-antitoxin system